MRALHDDACGLGPGHSARREIRSSMHSTEAYPPAQFFTDVGIVLTLLLTLALLFHILVIIR